MYIDLDVYMCHLGFVGMCGYFLPNCAFLFLLKSKFKKQMNNQTYRDRDRGEWHNISLELSRQHRRLHRKTKGDVPDFTTRDNKLFPNLKKRKSPVQTYITPFSLYWKRTWTLTLHLHYGLSTIKVCCKLWSNTAQPKKKHCIQFIHIFFVNK